MRMRTTMTTLLLLFSTAAFAAEEKVEVEGVAAVVNDDVAVARDRAIDDAKRKAVEQVAGTQVSAETITENFQLVEDKIYSRASGFVRKYEIVSELKEEGGVYRVRIKAVVDTKAIADNLDQLFAVKPRVIVMVAEQNVGSKGFSYWWGNSGFVSDMDIFQTTLIGNWQPRGFKFVDPALLQDSLQVKGAMKKAGLTNDIAVKIGRDSDADIAIVGKVLVSDAGNVMDGVKMHSFHAVGTMRILNIDTGEIVAVAEDTGVAPHVDPNLGGRAAIKALANKLGGTLEAKILAKWTQGSGERPGDRGRRAGSEEQQDDPRDPAGHQGAGPRRRVGSAASPQRQEGVLHREGPRPRDRFRSRPRAEEFLQLQARDSGRDALEGRRQPRPVGHHETASPGSRSGALCRRCGGEVVRRERPLRHRARAPQGRQVQTRHGSGEVGAVEGAEEGFGRAGR